MSAEWLTIGLAVLAVAGTLAGSAIAPILGADRAHKQWLRDKRAALFEQYYSELQSAQRKMRRVDKLGGRLPLDYDEQLRAEDWQHSQSLFDIVSRLELYASEELHAEARMAAREYQEALMANTNKGTSEQAAQLRRDFLERAPRVKDLIRRELAVE